MNFFESFHFNEVKSSVSKSQNPTEATVYIDYGFDFLRIFTMGRHLSADSRKRSCCV